MPILRYLDEAPVWEFWDRVAQLNVPVYLHPREPLPSQRMDDHLFCLDGPFEFSIPQNEC
jgi:hypothetical protein